jgi:hypothetical protein
LVILPFYNNPNGLPEGFPTESFCVKKASGGAPNQIKFIIRNTGSSPSGNFQWVPMFPTAGAAPAMVQVSLAPGAQKIVTQNLPANCYTPGFSGICQFSIELDTHNEVAEASEANNQDTTAALACRLSHPPMPLFLHTCGSALRRRRSGETGRRPPMNADK